MKTKLKIISIFFLLLPPNAKATTEMLVLPTKRNVHIYLMMGQSNMAGRGILETQDTQTDPRVLNFINYRWEIAKEPISDGSGGVGPGLSFGKAMAEMNPKITIGLVSTALGATPLSRWEKGGDLYEKTIKIARKVQAYGVIKGILWHQGESDSSDQKLAKSYGARFRKMVQSVRKDLGSHSLPIVIGELGLFAYGKAKTPYAKDINEALANSVNKGKRMKLVSTKDLPDRGDSLHFSASAQRILGKRYAEKMMEMIGKVPSNKN